MKIIRNLWNNVACPAIEFSVVAAGLLGLFVVVPLTLVLALG